MDKTEASKTHQLLVITLENLSEEFGVDIKERLRSETDYYERGVAPNSVHRSLEDQEDSVKDLADILSDVCKEHGTSLEQEAVPDLDTDFQWIGDQR